MKKWVFLIFFVVQISLANDIFWSKTGHRVIGQIAEKHLTRKTKRAINKILHGQSLAFIANFGDEIKSDRAYSKFYTWHFVDIPLGKRYEDTKRNPKGDLVTGINSCIAIITNKHSSEADREFYLKMLVHLLGDLTQPMHVGHAEDKGGNDIQVQWFGQGSNLHRVWDSDMIRDYGMSYSELSDNLSHLSKNEVKQLQKGTLQDWVSETQDLANKVYGSVTIGEKLGYSYSYDWFDTVEEQLVKGGLRLAKVLNTIFG